MAKITRYPKGSMWSSTKEGKEIYYAEIQYLGKRHKHNGSPNQDTVEKWLRQKQECIKALVDAKNEEHKRLLCEKRETDIVSREVTRIRHKYKGTIYSWTTMRNGVAYKRYAAEIHCRGRRIRKCGSNKEALQLWLESVTNGLNEICKEAQDAIIRNYENYVKEENRLKAEETKRIESYLATFGLKITSEVDRQDSIKKNNYKGTYTYILQDGSSSMFKIGKTKNLEKRLAAFCNKAYHYRYIHLGDIEKKLHRILQKYRLSGEWFNLDNGTIAVIKEQYVFIDVDKG